MKKLISLLLAMMMVFSLATVAFAAADNGTITINGVAADTVYEVYRMMDLKTYDKAAEAYTYEPNAQWVEFFNLADTKNYLTVTANEGHAGYEVKWIAAEDDATKAEFAKKALDYAKGKITPVKSSENAGEFVITENTGVFADLPLGWYLVDSNAGALCGLTTTDPDASVNAKNGTPSIDKQVQEDLSGMWGDVNTADIGQIVNFMTIIHAAAGAENYVMHDTMTAGLSFVQDATENRGVTEIKHINSLGVEDTLVLGTDYEVKTTGIDCTFEVEFTDDFIATLKPNERIIVYYNAMLNRHAQVGSTTGNINESWLEYGEDKYTTHDQTKTYTFSIDIVKTNSSNQLIDGAEFRIYDAMTGGTEIAVVPLMDANDANPVLDADGNPMYRRARADETGVAIVAKDGKVTVVGFDNGVYYLEETKAPTGYNPLTARKEFTIADANLDSVFNGDVYSTGSGVQVVNKSGNMLPETGAMGTTLFIAFGMFTVLATGVLLVTKKRMSMIED